MTYGIQFCNQNTHQKWYLMIVYWNFDMQMKSMFWQWFGIGFQVSILDYPIVKWYRIVFGNFLPQG